MCVDMDPDEDDDGMYKQVKQVNKQTNREYMHTYTCMQVQILLPLSGQAHLGEPLRRH